MPKNLNVANNLRIGSMEILHSPTELVEKFSLSSQAVQTVITGRSIVEAIIEQRDSRLLVVVGPCSIHDPQIATEYATRLKTLADEVSDKIYLVMRVYFCKPRTTVGWKGYINDPFLDGTERIEEGLKLARKLLIDICEMGLPIGTEMLDSITPQYIADLICWSAIGARTTESQTHRELASGLSMPVGFKNGTSGDLEVAFNAMQSCASEHSFLGVNQEGQVAVVRTTGNEHGHIVLRGGADGTNYDENTVKHVVEQLQKKDLRQSIVVDCSHANSNKDHAQQPAVCQEVVRQIKAGQKALTGVMIESNLEEGNQPLIPNQPLKYGVSITDKCIDWNTTEQLIKDVWKQL